LAIPFLSPPAAAQDILLRIPLDCDLGEICFIQQYVDLDEGPGASDYTGGPLSYDGHKGTDFRVADLAALAQGIRVLVPAAGIVRAVRDDMADRVITDPAEVDGRECGNGVLLAHGDGWETQLCHLAAGSITVVPGEGVESGQPLGLMGLSGATQFPHVHLSVRRNGEVVDPFEANLWAVPPSYEPGGFLTLRLSDAVPDFASVKSGTSDVTALSGDGALVATAYLFGGRASDVVALRIHAPDGGEIFAHDARLERDQAELFRAAGRRAPDGGWPRGRYRAEAVLLREGAVIDRIEAAVSIR
jgi:hypothetical protein